MGDTARRPSLLGDKDKGIEIVYGEEKRYFVMGRLKQPMQNKNLLYFVPARAAQWANQERAPFFEPH